MFSNLSRVYTPDFVKIRRETVEELEDAGLHPNAVLYGGTSVTHRLLLMSTSVWLQPSLAHPKVAFPKLKVVILGTLPPILFKV